MELQVFSIDEEAGKIEVSLTKKEALYFADKPSKEKEMYIMRKFVNEFQLFNGGSQGECFRQINEFRVASGYPAWQSQRSVAQIWEEDLPFYEPQEILNRKSAVAIFPDGKIIKTATQEELYDVMKKQYDISKTTIRKLLQSGEAFEPKLQRHQQLEGLIVKTVTEEPSNS
ncbi:hypothetical protein [Bacillus thuringiensis]|uniref:hypothetical protein n=1 Tax=Bacillus thuringiensis TaxID=1428 RepID=UPI001876A987|nr:hypothetical protein [Bacillus thuringiensis]MBE5096474.1 hypothetical protein [Bacillus thuringiensis]